MENLEIYEKVRAVPKEAQKDFNNGKFSGTDINPMWRIKTLTDLFGPCGIGWYYEITDKHTETIGSDVLAFVDINLYIKVDGEWSKPIAGTGGNRLAQSTKSGTVSISDEGYKMALTDALSVAAKALGVGADIYWQNDKTKYTSDDSKPNAPQTKAKDNPNAALHMRALEELIMGTRFTVDHATEWATKTFHKSLSQLNDMEFQQLYIALQNAVNKEKEKEKQNA